jgi:putative methylase
VTRALSKLAAFDEPDPRLEQVATPPPLATLLLEQALERGDLGGRVVVDLGCGTGILAIGAALLGARRSLGVDADPRAIERAKENAARAGVSCEFRRAEVGAYAEPGETVVMNPPFGAQRRHADRPFWEAAFRLADRAIYAFSLADSRSFIERLAVARGARVEENRPVRWDLARTFPHHRKPRVPIPVDLWILRVGDHP